MVDKNIYVKRFIKIHERKAGFSLSEEKALEYLENLVVLIKAVHYPISENEKR